MAKGFEVYALSSWKALGSSVRGCIRSVLKDLFVQKTSFPATQTSSVHCSKLKHAEQLELIISKKKDWG